MSPKLEIKSWDGKITLADTVRGNKMTLNEEQPPALGAGASPMGNVSLNTFLVLVG
jgi:hypothetical protein